MTVINSLNSFDDDYFASLKALSCVFDTLIESSALSPPFPNEQIALALQSILSKQRKMTPPDFIVFSFYERAMIVPSFVRRQLDVC